MTALNKQALREMAERAASDSWGYDRDEFNDAITPEVVLALLDELEAAEKRIAELEARTVTLPDEPFYPDGDIDCPLSVNLVDIKTACDEAGVPLVVRCGK